MFEFHRNLPVKHKVTLVILTASVLMLLLASGALFAFQWLGARETIKRTLRAQAQIIAANSTAALAFGDQKAGAEALAALKAQPHLTCASLFGTNRELFASYGNPAGGAALPPGPLPEGFQLAGNDLILFHPVLLDQRPVGTLCLRLNFRAQERELITPFLLITACVTLLGLLPAVLFSSALQRVITAPILRLTSAARAVADNQDYSVRAPVSAHDEIGTLTGTFNQMLARIQSQDVALRDSEGRFRLLSQNLELKVQERTGELNQANTSLRQSEERVRAILEHVRAGIVVIARQTHVVLEANPVALAMMGATREQVVGRVCHQFICPAQEGRCPVDDLGQSVDNAERLLVRVDGATLPILKTVVQVVLDGQPCLLESFVDLSERKRIQTELEHAKQAAEAASAAKSRFLANMSHEIRTPITGVMGMLQLLQRTQLDRRQSRYATHALTSAETLLTVIGDVLDFSKIEAGRLDLEIHPFDPLALVDTVARLFAQPADSKGIELVIRAGPGIPRQLLGDSNRLRQILVNLLGNAIKFTASGQIILACRPVELASHSATLRFEVRDTGCGIAPDKLNLIFQPFSQADNSTTRKYGGTGLGLAIARQLCELMGGRIGATSTPAVGSLFFFTVPLDRLPEPPAAPVRDLSRLRVLAVDDCAAAREICIEYLRSWRAEADDAPDGPSALGKLRAAQREGHPFDVVLIDWKMPGMDGLDLARLIKNEPGLSGTRLVLLTSFNSHRPADEILAAGFESALPKPANRSELYDAILAAGNPSPSPAPATPLGKRSPASVLLVEDNEINREVVGELLAGLGCPHRWARTGREAVEAFRHARFDLVLMDCQMPDMDGYEATRAIRLEESLRPGGPRIPIIALTAHAAKSDRDHCLEAGMDDYLCKPVSPELLEETLAKWIAGPAPAPLPPQPQAPPPAPPDAALQGDAPPIDLPSLLRRCQGSRALAARLLRMLLEQSATDLQHLARAVQQGDAPALAAAAHRLKGAAANVSAEPLRLAAATLETLARDQDLAQAPAWAARIQDELARLQETQIPPDSIAPPP